MDDGLTLRTSEESACIVQEDGTVVKQYNLLDTVWIRASASETRAHLPTLQLQLLEESTAKEQRKEQKQRKRSSWSSEYDEGEESTTMPLVQEQMPPQRSGGGYTSLALEERAIGERVKSDYSTVQQALIDGLKSLQISQRKELSRFPCISYPLSAVLVDNSALEVLVDPREIAFRRRLQRIMASGSRSRAMQNASRWLGVEDTARKSAVGKIRHLARRRERVARRAQARGRALLLYLHTIS
eukprot:scaffold518_cov388-Prasinococcus_capsulatus_cf.AAC.82